jgi:S-adenosylmethionine synthetase
MKARTATSREFVFTSESVSEGTQTRSAISSRTRSSMRISAVQLDLLRPIYAKTTKYGHFGRPGLPWEV